MPKRAITQGQGHATTYAQIIATELGLPASDLGVEEGDTDKAPYGAGTWGSRSTPVSGAATAQAARKIKDKAKKIAAHLLEVGEADLEWEIDRFKVKGNPSQAKTLKELCLASHTGNLPAGMEQGLNAVSYYDPPNLTFPFGAYLCVVDIDKFTGDTRVRRFYALDDCGTRINPMIIEGQIHGGLTEAFAVAMGQQMPFDEHGNHLGNSLMDYFLPTAMETPHWETDHTVTPCPHHPIGAKGVASCMPGAKVTERIDDTHYKGTVALKLGPASMSFRGDIEVKRLDAAARTLQLLAKGTDSAGGSGATMDLTARVDAVDGTSCNLVGISDVSVSGKAATFGSRFMGPVTDQVLNQFAANFATKVQAMQAPPGSTSAGGGAAAAAPEPQALNGLALMWAVIKGWLRSLFAAKRT